MFVGLHEKTPTQFQLLHKVVEINGEKTRPGSVVKPKPIKKYHQEYSKTVDVISGHRMNLASTDYTIKQLLLVPFCQFFTFL